MNEIQKNIVLEITNKKEFEDSIDEMISRVKTLNGELKKANSLLKELTYKD
ncbi:hypothetical protein HMPREF0501_00490 [Limosilactobacillus coleohominis 101-4-CHN]|uniref:Uncharacterized protein n=1 Tax=Limosilactobacillus coleohominis 101-4-CHN TaxID=575594 RepID=C7XUX4_9LACO|nr:hypothetical protein [Limosilactobacillus coleohominis]EEU31085.1 hypothetical protein HMPREF0501_00490 [Limosilactobacillus coleohominis 101-4-CHN]